MVREARDGEEDYFCLAPIPTFRTGMIKDRGQGWGRVVKIEVGEMT